VDDVAMDERSAVVWLRRDLRLHDNPALAEAAAGHASVVPLFVVDPRLVQGRFASANRTWFLRETLEALARESAAAGTRLVIRVGDPLEVVPAIAAEAAANDVYVARDYAPFGRARDRAVAGRLDRAGVRLHRRPGVLVHEPESITNGSGEAYRVYSPFRRAWERLDRRALAAAPERMGGHGLDPGGVPSMAELGFPDGPTADIARIPEPGEAAARARLERWMDGPVERYADTRDRLDLDGTSRLSQDLHFGLLSPLEVIERSVGPGAGRRTFVNELIWREFYAHVLFHLPEIRHASFRPEFDGVPREPGPETVERWEDGRTGYPVVDAAMRQLATTGWMHNRARMIVASFLTKHLLLDRRIGEAHFQRHLTDGDVASNNGGWQWAASTGTDPQPYFRIFNPILQGRRFDPDGAFVRQHVPELARVPAARIHAPWEMTAAEQDEAGCRIGVDYPEPIVDHGEARARALEAFEAARGES
jgi:deoxyribodipyrimidine photo-lyase